MFEKTCLTLDIDGWDIDEALLADPPWANVHQRLFESPTGRFAAIAYHIIEHHMGTEIARIAVYEDKSFPRLVFKEPSIWWLAGLAPPAASWISEAAFAAVTAAQYGMPIVIVDLRLRQFCFIHIPRGDKYLLLINGKGTDYGYEKLLLATGGYPRRLMFGGDDILYFRTLDDYHRLRDWGTKAEHFAVIGGGFIGSEIAAALAANGKRVTMVFPEAGICSRIFPRELTNYVTEYYRKKGVEVITEKMIAGMEKRDGKGVLTLRDAHSQSEQELAADGVVAGLGIRPGVELAEKAGLDVKNGIVVDTSLRTSHADIYAAGDVANFQNPLLGQRMRVEHEDNANTMGRMAGQAMAGKAVNYDHLPFFYSDLFDLGYEAVGETDSRLETVIDWKEPMQKGVIYYLKDGRVRGVLLWNVWEQVDAARQLIGEPGPFDAQKLKGRLPQ